MKAMVIGIMALAAMLAIWTTTNAGNFVLFTDGTRIHGVRSGLWEDGARYVQASAYDPTLFEWWDVAESEWASVKSLSDLSKWEEAPDTTRVRLSYTVTLASSGYYDLPSGVYSHEESVLHIQPASPRRLFRDWHAGDASPLIENMSDVGNGEEYPDYQDVLLEIYPSQWVEPGFWETPRNNDPTGIPAQVIRSITATTTVQGLPDEHGQIWRYAFGVTGDGSSATFALEGNVDADGKGWLIQHIRGSGRMPFSFRVRYIAPPLPPPTPTPTVPPTLTPYPTRTPTPTVPPVPPTLTPYPTRTPIPGVDPHYTGAVISAGEVGLPSAESPVYGKHWAAFTLAPNEIMWIGPNIHVTSTTYRVRLTYTVNDDLYPDILPIRSASLKRLYEHSANPVRDRDYGFLEDLSDVDDGIVDEQDVLLKMGVAHAGEYPGNLFVTEGSVLWTLFRNITATSTASGIPGERLDEYRMPKRLDAETGTFVLEGEITRAEALYLRDQIGEIEEYKRLRREHPDRYPPNEYVHWYEFSFAVVYFAELSEPQYVPTATPTATPSPTVTATPTPTATPTATATVTRVPSGGGFRGGGGSGGFSAPPPPPAAAAAAPPPPVVAAPAPAFLEPTATPTATPTVTATLTPRPTSTATPRPTSTATATSVPTATAAATWTPRPTVTATPTPLDTATPTATRTVEPTVTPTAILTATPSPTDTPTVTATAIPTYTPTATPLSVRGNVPTVIPTATPTDTATWTPLPTSTSGRTEDVILAGYVGTPTVEPRSGLPARVPAPATLTPTATVMATASSTPIAVAMVPEGQQPSTTNTTNITYNTTYVTDSPDEGGMGVVPWVVGGAAGALGIGGIGAGVFYVRRRMM